MKKGLIFVALFAMSTIAAAQQVDSFPTQTGGYIGPSIAITDVAQAKQLPDDSYVKLQGTIVKSLGKDKYLFRDKTGDITIEIDHKEWRGVTAGPNDVVEIQGEVDKGWKSLEIDVDSILKVN